MENNTDQVKEMAINLLKSFDKEELIDGELSIKEAGYLAVDLSSEVVIYAITPLYDHWDNMWAGGDEYASLGFLEKEPSNPEQCCWPIKELLA